MADAILYGKTSSSNLNIGTEQVVNFQENIQSGSLIRIVESPLPLFPELQSYNSTITNDATGFNSANDQLRTRLAISDNGEYVILSNSISRLSSTRYFKYIRTNNEYIINEITGLILPSPPSGSLLIDIKCNADSSIIYILERNGTSSFSFTIRIYTIDQFNSNNYVLQNSIDVGNYSLNSTNTNLLSMTVRNQFICVNGLTTLPIVYENTTRRNVVNSVINKSTSAYGQTSDDGVILLYGTPDDTTSSTKLRLFRWNSATSSYALLNSITNVSNTILNTFLSRDGTKLYTLINQFQIATSTYTHSIDEYTINRNDFTISFIRRTRIDEELNIPPTLTGQLYPLITDFKVSEDGLFYYGLGRMFRIENGIVTLLFDFTQVNLQERYRSSISNNFTDIISQFGNYTSGTSNYTVNPLHYRLSPENVRAYNATGSLASDINIQFFRGLGISIDSGIGSNKRIRSLWRN